ncbi:putative HC-toxin efflux carrier [Escovopsis weberi]|uniref:MFS transporter n=1 Tax=Escovopsis weberi TaxID=150374 RepID=A0A0M8MZD1_ESCWE|nr:putative HC-toxin efflux carrier [Escovopsis weberi]DAB41650.1 TPA_exp: MFS transporter [Escovopsis weberi]
MLSKKPAGADPPPPDSPPAVVETRGAEAVAPTEHEDDTQYPRGLKLFLIMSSTFVGMFLVALDRLIISTAVPEITDEFHSAGDIGWYGTAYLLTNCSFQLVFGKLYSLFRVKTIFMLSIVLFEIGSALCGAAPDSKSFIVGRAIAGLGSGGIMSGAIVIIVYALPLHKRPKYQGLFGAVFGVSSVLGPLVGGAFTTNVTWRWCFYINLPIGGVVMVFIFFLLHVHQPAREPISLKEGLTRINALGIAVLLPGVVCLCLALQWGGSIYPWSSGRVVALLVVAIVLLIAFGLIQVLQPKHAILPPAIVTQRSIASAFWVASCLGSHQTVFVYFLPIWFQAIKHSSAIKSGIDLLPMVLPIVASSILNGQLVSRIGYYTPPMLVGICLSTVGAGLLTTLTVDAAAAHWIGYQVVYGLGLGLCFQGPNMAAQTVLPRDQVAIGASLMFFGQQLFGSVFIAVGQNLFNNQLARRLGHIPGVTGQMIQNTGATDLLEMIPERYFAQALEGYNEALRVCFRLGLVVASIAILGGVGMEWLSVKKNIPSKVQDGRDKAERGARGEGPAEKVASEDVSEKDKETTDVKS